MWFKKRKCALALEACDKCGLVYSADKLQTVYEIDLDNIRIRPVTRYFGSLGYMGISYNKPDITSLDLCDSCLNKRNLEERYLGVLWAAAHPAPPPPDDKPRDKSKKKGKGKK